MTTTDRPVALVTGASRGIGRATAIALADAGFDVAVGARTLHAGEGVDDARPDSGPIPGSIEETVAEVEGAGARGLGVVMDLHDRSSLTAAADEVIATWGPIDVLVNNAVDTGPGSMTRFLDTDRGHRPQARRQLRAPSCTSIRHLLPGLDRAGRRHDRQRDLGGRGHRSARTRR